MKPTKSNYHSLAANKEYMSASQFKTFLECEDKGLAQIKGNYIRKTTKALLVGSYVDAYFSSCAELDAFTANHADELYTKKGDLRADFQRADDIIRRVERDKLMMEYLSGEPQAVMTGELFGSPYKVKIDSLHDDKIVDLKVMRDMKPIYKDSEWKDFITAWGYDIQGFIYQQIVEQNTGKHLPFYLAVATKEESPNIEIIQIPDWKLRSAGEIVKHYTPRFQDIKDGEILPGRCGVCDWCRDTKILDHPISYDDFIEADL